MTARVCARSVGEREENDVTEYADRLSQGVSWKDEPDEPEQIPASTYMFKLQDARIEEFNGRLFVVWEHYITIGEQEGQVARDQSALEPNPEKPKRSNQFAMGRAKARLTKMCEGSGVPFPDDKRDTEEAVAAIFAAQPSYRGKLTHSKDGRYTNVEVLEFVEDTNGSAPPPKQDDPAPASGEGVPELPDVGGTVVFAGEKGEEIQGEVVRVQGSDIYVKDTSGEDWTIDAINDAFEIVVSEDLAPLVELAEALEVKVPAGADIATVVKAVGAGGPLDGSTLSPDEKALCERTGVAMTVPEPPPPPRSRPKRAAKKAAKKKRRR